MPQPVAATDGFSLSALEIGASISSAKTYRLVELLLGEHRQNRANTLLLTSSSVNTACPLAAIVFGRMCLATHVAPCSRRVMTCNTVYLANCNEHCRNGGAPARRKNAPTSALFMHCNTYWLKGARPRCQRTDGGSSSFAVDDVRRSDSSNTTLAPSDARQCAEQH